MTVTDNDGATDSTTQSIDVSPPPSDPPTASFTASATSGEAPLEVSFDASGSSDPDGTIDSYSWDFDDGSTGSGVSINHTFDSSETYNVDLTVTDNDEASNSTSKTISVSSSNDQKLEILSWQLEKDSLDYARIVGEAKNVSGEEIDSATIGAKFFDASDTRLSVNYTPISDLASGVTTDFEIMTATEYSKVDHVDVYVDDVFIW